MYRLQPISSSVPNPSASGPRAHGYAIRAGGPGGAAVQVAECADSCDDDEPCSLEGATASASVPVCATFSVALGVWSVVHPPLG